MSPSSSATPKILAIIVNWNKKEYLKNLLESLERLEGTPFDIVVVDNASSDGSPGFVRENFPHVHVHETGDNLGGTGGFNAGMCYGLTHEKGYEYFWLLDNDVKVHAGALDALFRVMQSDPMIAIAGSTILDMEDESNVLEAGARIDWRTLGLDHNASGPRSRIRPGQTFECDYVAACSLLARVRAIEQVGIWDPVYFLYFDDVDWGIRMKQAGWRVVATSDSLIEHENYFKRRISSGSVPRYLCRRNELYTAWRLCPSGLPRARLLANLFRLTLSSADQLEFDGFPGFSKAHHRAVADFFSNRMGRPDFAGISKFDQEIASTRRVAPRPDRIRRLGVLYYGRPEFVTPVYERARSEFPNATIDVLQMTPHEPPLGIPSTRTRYLPMNSIWQRLRIAVEVFARYDALTMPDFPMSFLFYELAPLRIQYDSEGNRTAWPRDLGRLARYALRRVRTLFLSAWYTIKALRKPLTPVDYHPYRK